jgi:hypothetical protein
MTRAPYPSNDSVLSLFAKQVLPTALTLNNTKATKPAIITTNSGSLRFDVYSGPFTKNDQLTVSPFPDSFLYLSDVPYGVVNDTLNALNNAGANERRSLHAVGAVGADLTGMMGQYYESIRGYGTGDVESIYRAWVKGMNKRSTIDRRAMANLTLGYVTQDVSGSSPFLVMLKLTYFSSVSPVP